MDSSVTGKLRHSSLLAHNLPPEVMTLIWGFCDRDPRNLELVDTPPVRRQTLTPQHHDQQLPLFPPTPVIRTLLPRERLSIRLHGTKVPILTRVNRETREIAKRRFIHFTLMDMVEGRKYLFDPENDTFAIMDNWASIYGTQDNDMLQKVNRFAFFSDQDRSDCGYEPPRPANCNFRLLLQDFCLQMPIYSGQREYILLLKGADASKMECDDIVKEVLDAALRERWPILDTGAIVQRIYDAKKGPTMEKHSIAFRVETRERFFRQFLSHQ